MPLRSQFSVKMHVEKQPAIGGVLYKNSVLQNLAKFTGKHLRQSLFFNKVAGLRPEIGDSEKETLTQVVSCEFLRNFKEHLFYRTPFYRKHPDDWVCMFRSSRPGVFHEIAALKTLLHQRYFLWTLSKTPIKTFLKEPLDSCYSGLILYLKIKKRLCIFPQTFL